VLAWIRFDTARSVQVCKPVILERVRALWYDEALTALALRLQIGHFLSQALSLVVGIGRLTGLSVLADNIVAVSSLWPEHVFIFLDVQTCGLVLLELP